MLRGGESYHMSRVLHCLIDFLVFTVWLSLRRTCNSTCEFLRDPSVIN